MAKTHVNYIGVDLAGRKFNRLTALYVKEGSLTKWVCKCECGNIKEVFASSLVKGIVKSCGCLEKENLKKISKSALKHGMTETVLYGKWCSMKERCHNPNYKYYHRYGGRGIKICEEWLGEHGFENFAKWAYEAGYSDNRHDFQQTLDRIDTDGDYCPENCKWSNQLEQVRNRSNARLIEDIDGEKITSEEFSRKHSIKADKYVYRQLRKGKSAQEILDAWNEYLICTSGEYMTRKEASNYYGVSISTLEKWIKKGQINAVVSRSKYYILKGQPRPQYEEKYANNKK